MHGFRQIARQWWQTCYREAWRARTTRSDYKTERHLIVGLSLAVSASCVLGEERKNERSRGTYGQGMREFGHFAGQHLSWRQERRWKAYLEQGAQKEPSLLRICSPGVTNDELLAELRSCVSARKKYLHDIQTDIGIPPRPNMPRPDDGPRPPSQWELVTEQVGEWKHVNYYQDARTGQRWQRWAPAQDEQRDNESEVFVHVATDAAGELFRFEAHKDGALADIVGSELLYTFDGSLHNACSDFPAADMVELDIACLPLPVETCLLSRCALGLRGIQSDQWLEHALEAAAQELLEERIRATEPIDACGVSNGVVLGRTWHVEGAAFLLWGAMRLVWVSFWPSANLVTAAVSFYLPPKTISVWARQLEWELERSTLLQPGRSKNLHAWRDRAHAAIDEVGDYQWHAVMKEHVDTTFSRLLEESSRERASFFIKPLASIGIQLVPGDGTGEIRIRFGALDDGHVGNSSPSEMQGADRGHEHAFNLHEEPGEEGVFVDDHEEAGRWTQRTHGDNDDTSTTAEEEDSGAEAAVGVAAEAAEAVMTLLDRLLGIGITLILGPQRLFGSRRSSRPQMFPCEKLCGFKGEYDAVKAHEEMCAFNKSAQGR